MVSVSIHVCSVGSETCLMPRIVVRWMPVSACSERPGSTCSTEAVGRYAGRRQTVRKLGGDHLGEFLDWWCHGLQQPSSPGARRSGSRGAGTPPPRSSSRGSQPSSRATASPTASATALAMSPQVCRSARWRPRSHHQPRQLDAGLGDDPGGERRSLLGCHSRLVRVRHLRDRFVLRREVRRCGDARIVGTQPQVNACGTVGSCGRLEQGLELRSAVERDRRAGLDRGSERGDVLAGSVDRDALARHANPQRRAQLRRPERIAPETFVGQGSLRERRAMAQP